jgi:hypothetical protein
MNPLYTIPYYFFKIHLNIISHLCLGLPSSHLSINSCQKSHPSLSHALYMPHSPHSPLLDHHAMKQLCLSPHYFLPLISKHSPQNHVCKHSHSLCPSCKRSNLLIPLQDNKKDRSPIHLNWSPDFFFQFT